MTSLEVIAQASVETFVPSKLESLVFLATKHQFLFDVFLEKNRRLSSPLKDSSQRYTKELRRCTVYCETLVII